MVSCSGENGEDIVCVDQPSVPVVPGEVIQGKAWSLNEYLTKKKQKTKEQIPCAASWGWFAFFMCCHAFHNLRMIDVTAAENHIGAKEFPILFKAVISEGAYTLTPVFNHVETDLLSKHMCQREDNT